jgi:hypothetical protein
MERGRGSPLGAEGAREEAASEVWPKAGKPEEHYLLTMTVAMGRHFPHFHLPHSRLEKNLHRFDSPEHGGKQLGHSGRVQKAMPSIQDCTILKTRSWDEKRLIKIG